jgi:hypothetical protein
VKQPRWFGHHAKCRGAGASPSIRTAIRDGPAKTTRSANTSPGQRASREGVERIRDASFAYLPLKIAIGDADRDETFWTMF